ncbi:DNA phosphorothioation-dependent restriction protein DptH [Alteromonas ponticola]|uniref:DNA phosphorothioation-dependent restriction protein DptH n=1 Tax=Alteromonas aquimaris TaxID=2998417 RepID=A0ABT3P2Z3_9ALTE|nr:DNA phosphorothioation-dependent restriction protein DptH [Alteromonas aquimaris]MCW8107123.1 DNA phosphorothioation-dependent restriction protein DptH [Alteromonas aquimaris]
MSVKQFKSFETFVVEKLLEWAPQSLARGARYTFKSPNFENSRKLFDALIKKTADNTITYVSEFHKENTALPFIPIGQIKLIPLLHAPTAEGFTENFISHLRDAVAKGSEPFDSCCLLIIHNSKLDTIINSSTDLGQGRNVWSTKRFKEALSHEIKEAGEKSEISHVLLDYQFDAITQDNATLFGFEALYRAIRDGDLQFHKLYLLEDPVVHDFTGNPKQLRRRLDENRELYKKIETEVDNFPGQLEDRLSDKFSAKFIKSKFPKDDLSSWKQVTFDEFKEEIKRNQQQTLSLEEIKINGISSLFERTKGDTSAQKRDLHIIVQCPEGIDSIDIDIVWNGGDLQNEHLSQPNKLLPDGSDFRVIAKGSKRSKSRISVPFKGEPLFFTVGTEKRDKNSDRYRLHFLLLATEQFDIDAIKNNFLLNTKKKLIRLLTNETTLAVNPNAYSTLELHASNQRIDYLQIKAIDFKTLSEAVNDVEFSIFNGDSQLDFVVEGERADSSLSLPLLLDKNKVKNILQDNYFGLFNRDKERVVIDNKEFLLVSNRLTLTRLESRFIDEQLLYIDEVNGSHLTLRELEGIDEPLFNAYRELFGFCESHQTLPSLVSWGESFRKKVDTLTKAYIRLLGDAQIDSVLSESMKKALQIGLVKKENSELFSPYHPIVLSYYLELSNQIQCDMAYAEQHDETLSFGKIPKVTLDRLNARGLIPYLYMTGSDYAHVSAIPENPFWLEAVPHEHTKYDFVTKLVKEKISEFRTAFSDLFDIHVEGKLIINAVNQDQCYELLIGLVEYYSDNLDDAPFIHINIYDNEPLLNAFDRFAESTNNEALKEFLGLGAKKFKDTADGIIELLRTRLTYSKFNTRNEESYEYAHIAFFYNDEKVDCISVNIDSKPSGIAADGLLGGESSESQHGSYHTAFGLKDIDYEGEPHLKVARLFGSLIRPARESNTPYSGKDAVALAVNESFKTLLDKTCDSSIWTTVIDPKVTLDFFESQDKVLIHYSDQYTSSAGFDAITVSRQRELFTKVLELGKGTKISDFNAFNGDWLLKMLTSTNTARLGMEGEIGAYKLITALLHSPDMTWVPLSVGEMVRVSGNIGLKIIDSDFAAAHSGHAGAMSDDVLLVGLKNQKMTLMPVEVKTGSTPDYKKAKEQVVNLREHLLAQLEPKTLKGKIYRALFFRQLLLQVDKFKLYRVFPEGYFDKEIAQKNEWLRGEYEIACNEDALLGVVVSHLSSDVVFGAETKTEDGIALIDLPIALLPSLVKGSLSEFLQGQGLPKNLNLPPLLENKELVMKQGDKEIADTPEATVDIDSTPSQEQEKQGPHEDVNSEEKPQDDTLRVLVGNNTQDNADVYWEPTNTAKFMNTNSGIIGTMGTGKTQCTKSVITQLYRNQHNNVDSKPIGMLVFDYKSDYTDDKFIEATNAKKFKLFKLPYNPLSLFGDTPMLPIHTAAGFAETMSKAYGLGKKQQLKLENIILDAYDLAGIKPEDPSTWNRPAPTIENIWDLFLDQEKVEEDSLYAALSKLARFKIFETDPEKMMSLYELISGVTVIELAGYPSEVQNLIVALTLDLFYSQMQKQGKPEVQGDFRQVSKLILVDEADNFMSQNFSSLRRILKEGREYGVGVILSTQDITHFKTSENDYSAYILSWIVHRVSQIKNQDIKSIFNKDDKAEQEHLMKSIRGLEKHHSLYVNGEKRITKIRDKAFWELLNDAL